MTECYDVAIVGAGPAGNLAAQLLAEKGWKTVVLEEHPTIGFPVYCTGIIGAGAYDTFDLSRESIQDEVRRITVLSPSLHSTVIEKAAPMAYTMDRVRFDQHIAEAAMRRGAEFRVSRKVQSVAEEGDRVVLDCQVEGNGLTERIEARCCILASGSHSKLPYQHGITEPPEFVYAAQLEVEVEPLDGIEVLIDRDYAPGFFSWVVPIGGKWARVGMCSPDHAPRYLQKLLDSPYLRPRLGTRRRAYLVSRIPLGLVRTSHNSRIVAVGDAASQVKPATGGGIHYGLKCAKILADTMSLDDFQQGKKWNTHYFRRYDKLWKKEIGSEIRVGHWFKQFLDTMTNQDYDALMRTMVEKQVVQKIGDRIRFDHHREVIIAAFTDRELRGILFRFLRRMPSLLFARN